MEDLRKAVVGSSSQPSFGPVTFEAPSLFALLSAPLPSELQSLLAAHIRTRRWFRGKAREIFWLEVRDHVALRAAPRELALIVVRVGYAADQSETYVLPLAFEPARPGGLFELRLSYGGIGAVYDPSGGDDLSQLLLELFVRRETPTAHGRVTARPSEPLRSRVGLQQPPLHARVPSGEQSNTCVFFGDEFMLKLFRQLEAGENPDVELNEFLWAAGYRHIPEPLGSLSYERGGSSATLGIAQRFVPSDGTAWDVTIEMLRRAFELARALDAQSDASMPSEDLVDSTRQRPPESMQAFLAASTPLATLLGERTAELHWTLAADDTRAPFKPEPFTIEYQRSLVAATRERIARALELLAEQLSTARGEVASLAQQVLGCRDALARELDVLDRARIHASRIRCHGDYHLGQILYGEGDFIILDFEGEPTQPIEMRRLKRSALYDVCSMLRSFHYAATVALQSDCWQPEDRAQLACWSQAWYRWTSAAYLRAYLRKARSQGKSVSFLPDDPAELRALLRLHLIDKCSYELSYELNNRPAWVGVPLAGLLMLANGA